MKSILLYVVVFFVSLAVAVGAVFLVYKVKPDLLRSSSQVAQKPVNSAETADSTINHDSTKVAQLKTPDSTAITQSNEITALRDSLKNFASLTGAEKGNQADSLKQVAPVKKEADKIASTKTMAKMLDGMKAEQAVKIMNNLNDQEIKEILPLLNKRQAGKILSAFDPSRAAKILR